MQIDCVYEINLFLVTAILIIAIVTCGARRRRVTATFEFYQMRNETSESTNKNTYEELDNVVVYREGRKGPKLNTKEGETAFLTEFADNDHVYEEIKK